MGLVSASLANILIQVALAMLVPWISRSLGRIMVTYRDDYQPIAPLFVVGGSMGFNAVFRIFFAPISIVVASVLLFAFGMGSLVEGIWLASVGALLVEVGLLVGICRWSLVPKSQFLLFHLLSIACAYLIYQSHISKGLEALVPSPEEIVTEIWILVALFLYGVVAHVKPRVPAAEARKRRYVMKRARLFRARFNHELSRYDHRVTSVLLALMIYEDYNRPRLIRLLERLSGARTTGILQFNNKAGDSESIQMLGNRLESSGSSSWGSSGGVWYCDERVASVIREHNPADCSYISRIVEIIQLLDRADVADRTR